MAINTGIRCGEILALQKSDINLINDVIIINKTKTVLETLDEMENRN